MGSASLENQSYLYCVDTDLGWGNRSYFTFFSQFNRGATSSLLAAVESGVLVLFFLLSSVSNGVIFYTLSSNRRLRTVTNYLVCNLTLADVCFTLCCPLVAVTRVTASWTLGSFACKTIVYLSFVCGFVTIWTLMLISIDRYTCIVRNTKRRISPTLALVLIALVWSITLAAFTPLLIYFVVKDCPHGSEVVSICTLGWPRTPGVSVPVIFTVIVCGVGFLLPATTLLVCHVCIFVKVHKVRVAMAQQRQRCFSTSSALLANTSVWTTNTTTTTNNNNSVINPAHTTTLHTNHPPVLSGSLAPDVKRQSHSLVVPDSPPPHNQPLLPSPPTGLTTATFTTLDARRRRSSRELQVVKTLVYLVLLFFTLWAPIFVIFVLIMRDAYWSVMEVSSQAFLGAMCVAYSNAVLNPLAYGLSTERLRGYLHAMLTCSGRLAPSPSPTHFSNGAGVGSAGGVSGGVQVVRSGVGEGGGCSRLRVPEGLLCLELANEGDVIVVVN